MIKYALISCILISFLFSGNIAAQKPNQTTFEGPTANLKTLDMDKLTSIKDEGTKYKTFFLDDKPFSGLVKETADNGDYILHHMKNGRIELQMGYYADNSWERVVEMEDGMEHGKLLMFHPNGEKYIEQHYHHGEPIGLWSIWDDQGVLLEEKQHRVIIYKKEDQMKKSPVKE